MRYPNTLAATFISRPNRFIAQVDIAGRREAVHVKNTGRCRELFLSGARVVLTEPGGPGRKTRYDLIAVYREGMLVNVDSQAPNAVAGEYLRESFPNASAIRPECRIGDSRLDYCIEEGEARVFVEVKGVTLFENGTALFPDAPTERGVKHLRELTKLAQSGRRAMALFVIQAEWGGVFSPNDGTHPEFGAALREAAGCGVEVRAVDCAVTEDSLAVRGRVRVDL